VCVQRNSLVQIRNWKMAHTLHNLYTGILIVWSTSNVE
jgi:hypothetical protein